MRAYLLTQQHIYGASDAFPIESRVFSKQALVIWGIFRASLIVIDGSATISRYTIRGLSRCCCRSYEAPSLSIPLRYVSLYRAFLFL